MKLIAHRGNFAGRNPERENTVEYLEEALDAGYDVEFDVFCTPAFLSLDGTPPRGTLCLGHDGKTIESMTKTGGPLNRVPSMEWLRDSRKWVHCKDVQSYEMLAKYGDIQCFMQGPEDLVSYVSKNRVWVNSAAEKNKVTYNSKMIVHESWTPPTATPGFMPYAVYGDDVEKYKKLGYGDKPWGITTILLDVDGVMTNGRKTISYEYRNPITFSKEFCDKDWTAIKRMKAAGLRVVMVSADHWNKKIANVRDVEFVECETTGRDSKLKGLIYRGFDLSKCIYIGDDYYDLEVMWHTAAAYCPEDAIDEVKRCSTVIPAKGGENCVAAFYDMIKGNIKENFPHER